MCEAQTIEIARFPEQHFWHAGYDKAKQRDFVRDLDLLRAMIADRVAATRADLALKLMWRFLDLAEPVINRVDDSNGSVGDVFRSACEDLGAIAVRAKPDPTVLADRVCAALLANDTASTTAWCRSCSHPSATPGRHI